MTDTQPLYDLAPVLELMLLGLVIALGPLVWVWARNRRSSPMRRLQALTVLTSVSYTHLTLPTTPYV